MATSGSTDYSLTARDLVTFALRKIRVCSVAEAPNAEDAEQARIELNLLLKTLHIEAPSLWRQTFGSVTLVAGTGSYVLSPRPILVVEARYRNTGGTDIPMLELTRQGYVDLALKSATGVPTQFYVDRQKGASTLYVWPVPAAAAGETIQYTHQRLVEDVDNLANDVDIPQEHLEVIGYQLADLLLDTYGKDMPRVTQRAAYLKRMVMDHDREDYVQIMPERRF